ncbi:two component, sigma54 specific, transcriptional regulator, Fis family protein [Minicystis rosea]|nr:two component, sigma54 specific, transcriptional regulator, Fis family protein [Minicystis rosea]
MTVGGEIEIHLPPRYAKVAALGKGGGGEVWAVRDRIAGRTVALKALAEGADEHEVQALIREAVALSGVEGLGVPRVLRFGRLSAKRGGGRSFMVRELVEGRSLADLLPTIEPLAAIDAVARAADQLTRLHRALLLHGDLKPANIIVSPSGRATLVDLGLAATWREGGARPEGLTPKYAAPELLQGAPLTVRAEVYTLGATIDEVLQASGDRLEGEVRAALREVVSRATATDPGARFPSADELGSALRSAARLAEPSRDEGGVVWPIVALDGAAGQLLAQIAALRAGGGVVITGPRLSGRSTLLRRIAWSIGVERPVAWVEPEGVADVGEALSIELSGLEADPRGLHEAVVLVDDADRLGEADFQRLDAMRRAGVKLVLVLGNEAAARSLSGPTFEVFAMPRLSPEHAGELVRRTIPSLSDAGIAHVAMRAEGWPGRVREVVARLSRAPVVAPADVDRILEEEPTPSTGRGDLARLLDKGHFDEAAEILSRYEDDASPEIAVARARLFANRGDAPRAIAELTKVIDQIPEEGDDELAAGFWLAWARAHLRAGDYAETEQRAAAALERFGVGASSVSDADSRTRLAGSAEDHRIARALPASVRRAVAELVAVRGLAQSFASRHAEARATIEQSVRLARVIAEPRLLSLTLGSLAFALHRDDRLPEAKAAYEEALAAAEEAGDAGTVATTRLNLASITNAQGDIAAAVRHYEAAIDMGRRSGRVTTVRQALLNLANLELYLGRLARARVSIDALAGERDDLFAYQKAQLQALEAEYAERSGDLVTAERLCLAAAEAYNALGRNVDEAEARLERVLWIAARTSRDSQVDRADRSPDTVAEPAALGREIARAATLLGGATAHRGLLLLARGRIAALADDEAGAREAYDEALEAARAAGQKDLVFRVLDARAALEAEAGQAVKSRRDREAAVAVLEEIAERLPRDLREVFWNDPRRQAARAASIRDLVSAATAHSAPVGEDRLARVLEINRAIAGELDLDRLLEKVTDHAIALLRAERGFVILRSGYASHNASSGAPAVVLDPPVAEAPESPVAELSIHASRDQFGADPHARFSQSIADKVISSGEPVVTHSARDDARMAGYVSVHQLMLQSVACVPIRARSGAVIGALYLETRLRPAGTFAEELPTLAALADQVAIAIETARLVGENARRAAELERANGELEAARAKLEELLGHRTAQLQATRRDLRSARAVIRGHFGYEGLVGTSEAMRRVYALIDRVKDTDVPVLITGESGTGKEVVARAIHNAGPRGKKPFVGINCGAIPEHLLESELFGHVRGAFTGADRDRKGLFREATEGTILLDEIGEMPHKMQAGLLRVLQEKLVRPVGGPREEPVDTRVIAATHRDLSAMVEAGKFREDLYYRLHVIQVRVPPLRERLEDLPILIDHFLGIFAARYNRERRSVSRAGLKRLMAFNWPGNVRQLENVLLNAWVLSDEPELSIDDFELPNARPPRPPAEEPARRVETSLDAHKAGERERILEALARCNWNRVKAAQLVGLPRRTFYRRLKEYGIQ